MDGFQFVLGIVGDVIRRHHPVVGRLGWAVLFVVFRADSLFRDQLHEGTEA